MKTRFRYINFKEHPTDEGMIYLCFNNKNDAVLGMVEWYAPWRTYVFSARSRDMVFNSGCLNDISEFMNSIPKRVKKDLSSEFDFKADPA